MINRILLLAPHPDDGEFSCGGSLKKWTEEGKEIWYMAFSPCNKSLTKNLEQDTLFKELPKALGHLGITKEHIFTHRFPVREFLKHRQEILEILVKTRQDLQPDLVLLPNTQDIHQDHQVISQEGIRAFKHTCIMGYELSWNNFKFTSNAHVALERKHIEAKISAIKEYKSQAYRNYTDEEFFYGLAKMRGIQVNKDYAEAFEMIRWIL